MWQGLVLAGIAVILANTFSFATYKRPGSEPQEISVKTLGRWLILPISYAGLAFLIWQGFGSLRYSTIVYTLGPSALDLSESNNIFDNEMEEGLGVAYTGVSFFASFFVPALFVGSLAFAACAGAGLAFFPYELITWYMYRPRKVEPEEFVIAKKILQKESEAAILIAREAHSIKRELTILAPGDDNKRRELQREFRIKLVEAHTAMVEFEQMLQAFQADENILESNPLTYYFYLALGAIGATISGVVVLQTLMPVLGLQGVLEYLLLRTESDSFIVAAGVLFVLVGYLMIAIGFGSINASFAMDTFFQPITIRPEGTFRDSLHMLVAYVLPALLGMMLFLVRHLPRYMRYLGFDLYFNRVLTQTRLLNFLYRYNAFEWLFLSCFLIALFVLTFATNGAIILREKVAQRTLEIQMEKEEVARLDKMQRKTSLA